MSSVPEPSRRTPEVPTPSVGQVPSTPLEKELVAALETGGPVTFAEYMEAALYHPEHGYYARQVPGPASDYRTSPSLTPWFGRLIARALERQWQALGGPGCFTVVEVGAGGADLATSAFAATAGSPFGDSLRWRFVERFDAVQALQRSRLPEGIPVEWVSALGQGEPVDGCVLANEVLDNMPAHVFELTEDGLREVLVAAHGGHLVEQLGPPPDQVAAPGPLDHPLDRAGDGRLGSHGADRTGGAPEHPSPSPSGVAAELASRALPYLEEGDRFEVRPAIDAWCQAAARTLRRGSLIVIDYGDVEPDLWLARPAGSVVTYRLERLGDDPLQSPGLADITAHVDFSHLRRAAADAGLVSRPLVAQRDFLLSLGLRDVVQSLRDEERRARDEGRHTDAIRALAERGRVEALAARGGLGDLLVFAAGTP